MLSPTVRVRILKHIINWVVWTLLGLYAIIVIAIHTTSVQQWLGTHLAEAIGKTIGTQVSIGRVDLGFLNRLILDDVNIKDQNQRPMFKAARMTVKIDLPPLALGQISISSAQIFGAHLNLSRPTASSPLNIQFVIDSLASRDTTASKPLNLQVNSFIVRGSSVSYDQWDAAQIPNRLNPHHLKATDISAYIILKTLTDDSLNVNVKRMSVIEQSGLFIKRLSFLLAAGKHDAQLRQFKLQMPDTQIRIDSLGAKYDSHKLNESLCLKGRIDDANITPSDFRILLPELKKFQRRINLVTDFSYEHNTLQIPQFSLTSGNDQLELQANGTLMLPTNGNPKTWKMSVDQLKIGDEVLDFISKNFMELPHPVLQIGDLQLKGAFNGDTEGNISALADVSTDIGKAMTRFTLKNDRQFDGAVTTDGLNLNQLLENEKLGIIAADLAFNGIMKELFCVKGAVSRFDFDNDSYRDISLDGRYADSHLAGHLQINDPKVAAQLDLDVHAKSLKDAVGAVSIHHLSLPEKSYQLEYLHIKSDYEEGRHHITLNSDFAHADLVGQFDYTTLAQSVANAVGTRMPTLPGLPPLNKSVNNNFTLQMTVAKTDWLQKLLNVNVDVTQPLSLSATVNDNSQLMKIDLQAPGFSFNDSQYKDAYVHVNTPTDTMTIEAGISSIQNDGLPLQLDINGFAANNNLQSTLHWDNNDQQKPVSGILNAATQFYVNNHGLAEAHARFLPSTVIIDNSKWLIEPSDVLYSSERLLVDHFIVHNDQQYITIDGTASKQPSDTVVVDLKGVEVAYILDLVNFDAVTFSGKASGRATLSSVLNAPDMKASLSVHDFKFQEGRMGTLNALVNWNKQQKQIDIHATANDGPEAMTYIDGYVSPEKDFIDLGISAHGTYLDFMHSFTESFISHITGHGTGDVRLAGPLSAINLTGGLVVSGEATITPTNTTYQLRNDTITLIPNKIHIDHQPLYDKHGNIAYLSGGIFHEDLTNLSLDLNVTTDKFLGYDFDDFGDQSFYGTVFAAGNVNIRMKGDDVHIDCHVTPLKNTVFVYNAAQTDAINSHEYITWHANSRDSGQAASDAQQSALSSTNIYMTFLVNATPEATMRLLMDAKTGDYITLAGNGTIQASYYNKGAFQMQGIYTVETGTYDVTIQNIINKKFQFQQGGTITFGGDPYEAALNLQALYTVNGVSLSDLNIGNSFSSNTVRVNCLMNIGGQPMSPQVTFDLDIPNVNADEKQMIRSLLSSQQEMNQQVLYLLSIGRFYSQGQNNAAQQEQLDRTSLAMNSFLSGTLSTQINNVLNQILRNNNWNFGANISTGTEGWNNAEYEGIVNGRMLNNRLLINGQFGYRDNATQASPSFIGDFDVRYLLTPNGNYALKVYNQTNDRYFTRSSLNTQGIGIIMKKDFNSLGDFFGIKKNDKNRKE